MEIRERTSSPDHTRESLKSHRYMNPPESSDDPVTSDLRICSQRSSSPDHSSVSLKSDRSMLNPPKLSDEAVTSDPRICSQRSSSPDHSCVSLKSDGSMGPPPALSGEAVTSDPRADGERSISGGVSSVFCLNNTSVTASQNKHDQAVNDELQRVKEQHKTSMKNKYERLCEGLKLQENESLLNSIYTQLYIIEGEREGVNEEHEALQMEKTARTQYSQDAPIYCNDIFQASAEAGSEEKEQIKTVLTKGIAGIGKTVSVQKFILDWAEGKANQDVDFMFVLPFRELNLIRDHQYSLHRLLLDFHPELQDLDSQIYEECKVVLIFDGLDESRITLMFSDAQKVCDVTETSSVAVLMSKLMKGELLPSALIWITSRPAAANQIPSEYIHRLTEIQGFTEPQKEEYFRKRISDEHQASRIISHIRRARSLHIMCHIPVFCWISSTVLQKLLEEDLRAEIPQTLTEMYIHFLLIQINMRKQKYEERDPEKLLPSNREVIVKLAEVAFKQLMKGNVMFYEEDLIESGIDVTDASVYSGICTEIFKQESVIHQRKVYSFVHLSVQEFLAAFYEIQCYLTKNKEPLHEFRQNRTNDSLYDLLRSAVDKALKSENGRLDLFLRFLLGVSLESNQRLLQDLLTHTENSSETISRTTQYIKDKIKRNEDDYDDYYDYDHYSLSADQSINLFLCLLEVKDQTLFREIQEFVKSNKHSEEKLSPAHCSTISYMIQMSEEPLDELDLQKYNTSYEGRRRLIPAVINCRKARLRDCGVTEEGCVALASALRSNPSHPRQLNLSLNNLGDSGVKCLCAGLEDPHCKLETLCLSDCCITVEGCAALASALRSNPSHLRHLDLSGNNLEDLGVKRLCAGLEDPHCKLEKLWLSYCLVTNEGCSALASALRSNPSHLRELDMSRNKLGQSGVKSLCAVLEDRYCKLEKLWLSNCGVTDEGCAAMASALRSNPSHLRELNLSQNELADSGVKRLSAVLEDLHCKLEQLWLSDCGVTDEGCAALTAALRSNPSHMRKLGLSMNKLGDSGVKCLCAGLEDPDCKLEKLWLRDCGITDEGCSALASALRSNPSHLRVLDLSVNKIRDLGVKRLCAGLEDPRCKLEKLWLSYCDVTDEGCSALTSPLRSNPSHLRELDLSWNKIRDSGVKRLCAGLEDPHCKLEKLWLWDCGVTDEGCSALTSALRSNPSHLRELDLSGNKIRDSGVKRLCAGLEDPHCKLEKLWLSYCDVTDEGCSALTSALRSNPSHLREMYLTGNKIRDLGVKRLCAGLEDPHCKLEKLRLRGCDVTDEGCSALTSALRSNPSHLRELNLSWNKIRDLGVKCLCAVLEDPLCKLEKLWLRDCGITDEGCSSLTSALRSNPSHLRELDLSVNKIRDLGVKRLCAVLEDPRCKLEKLWLSYCGVTDEGCSALTSALRSNPLHLRELRLSENKIRDSGVKCLCAGLEDPHCKLEILWLSYCDVTDEGCSALTSALRSNPSHLRELNLFGNNLRLSEVKLLSDLKDDPHYKLERLYYL
ncbi:NACHT, LRR and PYD domains-containing protein 12 isoform X13 [Carassius gibelio]|uniref:NACHT, LRR and PYD domains-containing protein 12 isoform X13 n=1 Tax=Carassius gibelio TaxID=101364 RepID=UPI0022789C7C|nr:NACHT, LRR and PYD domains-containing protein 12 isoform X13 [Carassius gibelio]